MHSGDERLDPTEAKAVLDQFVALGYIEKPDEDKQKALDRSITELNYNLAVSYMDGRRPRRALPLLKELHKEKPEDSRFTRQLAQCHLALRNVRRARSLVEAFLEKQETGPWSDLS